MTERFKNKVVLVTGGANGLGKSHVLGFAREGANIAVADICGPQEHLHYDMSSKSDMDKVVDEVCAMGNRAIGIKCDVSKSRDVEAMVNKVVEEFGRIDVLVNNAGVASVAIPVWNLKEEVWDMITNVMLKGTFLCSKYTLPVMIRQKSGKIVNTSSIGAKGQAGNAPYSAAKAAIEALTVSIAKEVGEFKINVNCVGPGLVMTSLTKGALRAIAGGKEINEDQMYLFANKRQSILGEPITMSDITNAVLFLCSEEARNINGSTIYVDGGFLAL
jgi:NAD(P)-dependent dehydrogenase (short-subunit alcohol dehydrogenase family)